MKHTVVLFFFGLLLSLPFASAKNIRISGFVKDRITNEVLIGANVSNSKEINCTSTDNRGYFNLYVRDSEKIIISYVSYLPYTFKLKASRDTLLTIYLESGNVLNELTVSTAINPQFEVSTLKAKELELIPSIGGKPDVMKALQLLPGVQTTSEGTSLMLVRGGDPGQNHYLLDNVPLIYVNHLGGFTSVFNPDMINQIDFYKGNFPARYGGKLSSIVDISQREGDISKRKGSYSIGISDASFTIEGPLAKGNASYIVTARKTLIDALMAIGTGLSEGNNNILAYGFHDINAKISWKVNTMNSLSMNFYQGDDYLNSWAKKNKMNPNESSHLTQQWGNWLVSGRWYRVLGSKGNVENILSFTRYRNFEKQRFGFDVNGSEQQIKKLDRSSVQDFSWRSGWNYRLFKKWKMNFGGQLSSLLFEPSFIYRSYSSTPVIRQLQHSYESSFYLDNTIDITPSLQIQPSLRFTDYLNEDTHFDSFEPRLNLKYKISTNNFLNFNYMIVSQNSHLIFSKGIILNKEIWLPASEKFRPQRSKQYNIGWMASLFEQGFISELNVYYKKMENLVTLKEGYENMVGITDLDNKLLYDGVGTAYGTELTLKKVKGDWKGFVSYAWSEANRQFQSINGGKVYDSEYNRPHMFTLNMNR